MTIEFGDDEPEDAWDDSDGTPELLQVLWRMVDALDGEGLGDVYADQFDGMLQRVAKFTKGRHEQLSGREGIRVFHIIEGIALLKARY